MPVGRPDNGSGKWGGGGGKGGGGKGAGGSGISIRSVGPATETPNEFEGIEYVRVWNLVAELEAGVHIIHDCAGTTHKGRYRGGLHH